MSLFELDEIDFIVCMLFPYAWECILWLPPRVASDLPGLGINSSRNILEDSTYQHDSDWSTVFLFLVIRHDDV